MGAGPGRRGERVLALEREYEERAPEAEPLAAEERGVARLGGGAGVAGSAEKYVRGSPLRRSCGRRVFVQQ